MMTKKILCLLLLGIITATSSLAQDRDPKTINKLERKLKDYFSSYKAHDTKLERQPQMTSYKINDSLKTITIKTDGIFAQQDFSTKIVEKIYKKVSKSLPSPYDDYKVTIITNGMSIEELVPNFLSDVNDESRMWGKIEYKGKPWTENISRPNNITHGLQNRHISLWSSHGRYFDAAKNTWKWQRPNLFCTTEDLFTQTIVVPYLIPMLENAGAIVFTPRERDWQKNEVIVDNDGSTHQSTYMEIKQGDPWTNTPTKGFSQHSGSYAGGENPFNAGTARMVATAKNGNHKIVWQPNIPKEGKYAVYVSYQTMPNSIDNAQYIVHHKGQETIFSVNQTMGGGTWVYLGTFDFDAGNNEYNNVVLTNVSKKHGVVSGDAVRFGGGMGNIQRGGTTSGLPRCLEGARYYAQWAGAPYNIVSLSEGKDDYKDDINVRSMMTNWLAGGSCYVPNQEGKNVPIELSLAVHSDAGVSKTDEVYGTLGICTTNNDDKPEGYKKILDSGISRMASRDFADMLLSTVLKDLKATYGNWTRRSLWDRNYSETRRPEVPSAILETLSHQNFTDMRYALDPNFRFTLARAVYKSIARYIAHQHGKPCIITPLQPSNFHVAFTSKDEVTLSWNEVSDELEPTANATSYNVYVAEGTGGFDNGTNTTSTHFTTTLTPGSLYRFKVTACNRGGESFPTEELTALYEPDAKQTILIVNGFHRLSAPKVINNDIQQGFDIDNDPGVGFGINAGWAGRQLCFDKSQAGKEGPGALGYCENNMAGTFVAGNDFNYTVSHSRAIQTARKYNIVSCSSESVENGYVNLNQFDCTDLLLGLEKNDRQSLKPYKTFTTLMQQKLSDYTKKGGRLLVSGAFVASDMTDPSEQHFLAEVLKLTYGGSERSAANSINGLGMNFNIFNTLNENHYAATATDILSPVAPAFSAMQYADNQSACVAYSGSDYKCFTIGFPFECITDTNTRAAIMRGILAYLLK